MENQSGKDVNFSYLVPSYFIDSVNRADYDYDTVFYILTRLFN